MSDIIHVLPDFVANQIAAGEVIQRPASAVKELIENAVDAGATSIELIVKHAGRTLIQVNDNGMGMSETDARLCFERHATSKISSADDLFALRTKGFRGEALASIAAIAHVELRTRKEDQDIGTHILIEGAVCKEQNPDSCEKGTSILVKNLFYNVPARRNFLKSDNVEYSHIHEEFIRVALVHPEIAFSLYHNDKQEYMLPKSGLKQRIVNIFGKNYNERLLPVEQENAVVKISGFVGKPEFAKKTRGEQYLYANQRFIKHPYLQHAIVNAMQELLPSNHFPSFFIFLDLDPEKIDVNIHPTKTEVKFQEEKFIYSILRSTVRHSLGAFNSSQTIDFENISPIDFSSISNKGTIKEPKISSNPNYNPFETTPQKSKPVFKETPFRQKQDENAWSKIYESLKENITISEDEKIETQTELEGLEVEDNESFSIEPASFQIFEKYIITRIKSGFMIIDIETAMERILYERFLNKMDSKTVQTQKLLFPETLNFSPQDADTIQSLMPEFVSLGFEIESFGKNTFILNGVPCDLLEENFQKTLEQLLESYKGNMISMRLNKKSNLAFSMARILSKKNNKDLQKEEIEGIISALFACSCPQISPKNKKTCLVFTQEEIDEMFR